MNNSPTLSRLHLAPAPFPLAKKRSPVARMTGKVSLLATVVRFAPVHPAIA